ncbi:MAG: signal peptide protein, partial [Proteobacteria bacterium]|nr:signal peptide protein [Pseudomonadota bacterium]
MNKLTLALASAALAAVCALPVQAKDTSGPVTCSDGTTSPHGGRGACSKHGGIKKGAAPAAAAASAA